MRRHYDATACPRARIEWRLVGSAAMRLFLLDARDGVNMRVKMA